jgi:hypothetical protein
VGRRQGADSVCQERPKRRPQPCVHAGCSAVRQTAKLAPCTLARCPAAQQCPHLWPPGPAHLCTRLDDCCHHLLPCVQAVTVAHHVQHSLQQDTQGTREQGANRWCTPKPGACIPQSKPTSLTPSRHSTLCLSLLLCAKECCAPSQGLIYSPGSRPAVHPAGPPTGVTAPHASQRAQQHGALGPPGWLHAADGAHQQHLQTRPRMHTQQQCERALWLLPALCARGTGCTGHR